MTAKEQRFKADEIQKQAQAKKDKFDDYKREVESKIDKLQEEIDKNKRNARVHEFRAGSSNTNTQGRVRSLAMAAKEGSEAIDLKHKKRDLERELASRKRDTEFEIKQMNEQATRLKVNN